MDQTMTVTGAMVLVSIKDLTQTITFWALISVIALDILSGKAKAMKHRVIDSTIGLNGILKHSVVLLMLIILGVFSRIAGFEQISLTIALFYILEYITSIMENLDALGVPLPEQVKIYFNRMRQQYDAKVEVNNKKGVNNDDV